ncbi:anti-sigma factor domain-containing protein [Mechercharimyces sp. CAU 1602]|uniref:anti-sigma-I factor RsgI family protein n=1 Tax=Mechercharimyces sp. CAU 1602 TaxID=2973933 RepID=UPI00216133FB|nr:anti-sigma factor domain-containing protein [Mechercharimyces sp. CAU 1602]MCS1351912.1 anti-sigma factor domain-containing protein [Mechercharimyces sp. CAU 1602]
MRKGIVMEVRQKSIIVMTATGEFKEVRRGDLQAQLGEEINLPPVQLRFRFSSFRPLVAVGGTACLALLLFLYSFMGDVPRAYAERYIYIDIEDGIELGLDKKEQVVEVRPLTSSAERIVEEISWEEKDAGEVVLEYLRKAQEGGVLHAKEKVVVSGVANRESEIVNEETLSEIQEHIKKDDELSQSGVFIYTVALPEVVQVEAKKNALSPGKYAMWLVANRTGLMLALDDVEHFSMDELIAKVEESDPEILRNPPPEEVWIKWINEAKLMQTQSVNGKEASGKGGSPGKDADAEKLSNSSSATKEGQQDGQGNHDSVDKDAENLSQPPSTDERVTEGSDEGNQGNEEPRPPNNDVDESDPPQSEINTEQKEKDQKEDSSALPVTTEESPPITK